MYASVAELQRRIGDVYAELYVTAQGQAMTDEAGDDLAAASAEIDGACGMRYTVPVTSPQALPLLKSWCLTLAEELAWARSGRNTPDGVKERVKAVRELLAKVAEGKFTLAGADVPGTEANGGIALVECEEPVFGRSRMKGL